MRYAELESRWMQEFTIRVFPMYIVNCQEAEVTFGLEDWRAQQNRPYTSCQSAIASSQAAPLRIPALPAPFALALSALGAFLRVGTAFPSISKGLIRFLGEGHAHFRVESGAIRSARAGAGSGGK